MVILSVDASSETEGGEFFCIDFETLNWTLDLILDATLRRRVEMESMLMQTTTSDLAEIKQFLSVDEEKVFVEDPVVQKISCGGSRCIKYLVVLEILLCGRCCLEDVYEKIRKKEGEMLGESLLFKGSDDEMNVLQLT